MQPTQQIAAPTEIQQVASTYKMGGIHALHGATSINYLPGIIVLGLGLLKRARASYYSARGRI